jgi:ribosomal protein S18 acetylase RimI-like enzyme
LFRDPDRMALQNFLGSKLTDGSDVLIAIDKEQALGYLLAEYTSRAANPFRRASSSMYVHHIAVSASAQGSGVGRLLMDRAEELAKAHGASAMRLDSWQFNTQAHGFFESQGFTPVNVVFERLLQ